ncbi:MAG: hypothetical protein IJX64_06905 [Clostridia bacterium]|nr:hypothetical protein [Clostridia bacterium]
MLNVSPKNMIRTYQAWEGDRSPRVPFPTVYMARCLFTLYLELFLCAFLMYRILIPAALAALAFFFISYYAFMRLWKLLELSSWRFHLFFAVTGAGVCWLAVWLRTALIDYLVLKGW